MKILLMRLESPLMAFGGVAVDAKGVTDDLPSASLVAGTLGNSLGFCRTDTAALQALQDRLRFVVRIDRPGTRMTDYQTADLKKSDKSWTTRGSAEGREGSPGAYAGQHQRYRDYHADAAVTLALTLVPAEYSPTLEELARALDYPARPLFIGRKPCLPSARLLLGVVEEDDLIEALRKTPIADDADTEAPIRMFRPANPDDQEGVRTVHGLRNWRSNVHQGAQSWVEIAMRAQT